jgi:hypothetical protein
VGAAQAVEQEPLFKGTTVYLGEVLGSALKSVGDVAYNKGLESDGQRFAQAKPHIDLGDGAGNPV